MPYIYCITNKLNNKMYVGKTLETIEKRWKEHIKDSRKEECANRPLYRAFNKYGIENFGIEELEEVFDEKILNEREVYWIEILGTFKNGYNATLGGDGRQYADYDLIFSLFKEGKNNKEIQKITGYDHTTITKALCNRQVSAEERKKRGRECISKTVAMLDLKTEEIIKVFPSIELAYKFLKKQSSGHISAVCTNKRKSAYGYKWKLL